eukprot:TRINITY_DN82762_c0_g1_i1.p1 TRINITY_DN82762_c0_g1~~TRINITY_DN82762_c0_g1_i1.p1  ORF type:complete len:225 (+),score=54.61 TRINITY_DN82762_c0_g1_i1:136-810(+)
MFDDFDIYPDDENDSNPFLAPAEVLPAPALKATQEFSGDAEDGDAVEELLKQLRAAKDQGLDAEFGADLEFDFEFDDTGGNDVSPSQKRPRVEVQEPATKSSQNASSKKNYWYNPVTNRWEPDSTYKASDASKYQSAQRAQDAEVRSRLQERRSLRDAGAEGSRPARQPAKVNYRLKYSFKTDLCWQFSRGVCKKGEKCYWAHGREELRGGGDAETLKQRMIAE